MNITFLWIAITAGLCLLFINRFISRDKQALLRRAYENYEKISSDTLRIKTNQLKTKKPSFAHRIRPIVSLSMPVLISLIVLGCALWIILSSGYPDAHQKWAFGVVGTIVGYWLKA
jgi:hypothetical protein